MTVADYLKASTEAHAVYRSTLIRHTGVPIRASLVEASEARAAAVVLDAGLEDAAWGTYEARYPHAALTAFYAEQVAK